MVAKGANGGHAGQVPGQPGAPEHLQQQPRPQPPQWYSPDHHINERRKMVSISLAVPSCQWR
jgi:hypothetical protein